MNMEWMNGLALLMGWVVLICGGLFLVAVMVQQAVNYLWGKVLLAMSFAEVASAVRKRKRDMNLSDSP